MSNKFRIHQPTGTAFQGRNESVCIFSLARIISELELIAVTVQIFRANMMIDTDYSTLQETPKVLDVLSMNTATHEFFLEVSNPFMGAILRQSIVGVQFVGNYGRAFSDVLMDDGFQRSSLHIINRHRTNTSFLAASFLLGCLLMR
jgi:hypothetical protein